MNDVTIVGGGPTGLMLAAELALAKVDVEVLERRPTPELVGSRARGFHARTIELLDQRGIVDPFLAEGQTVQVLSFGSTPLDLSGFPSRHPYTLGLAQRHVERLLLDRVEELGVPVRRGVEATGFDQDDDGVDVHLAGAESLRTAYVVGADGGRSVIRSLAGIDFVGAEATRSHLIAEVEVSEEIPSGMRLDEVGIHAMNTLEDGRTVGLVVTERRLGPATEPTLADLSDALTAVYGTDFGVHSASWISRFTDATRQAVEYRRGRVLVAGDAAHVHPPTGGQGIGLGVQDAVNLGWKLAATSHDWAPPGLLDSYDAERRPLGHRVAMQTQAQLALFAPGSEVTALRQLFTELLQDRRNIARIANLMAGADIRYDMGVRDTHPLVGRWAPDLVLDTGSGPVRLAELTTTARPLLLDLTEDASLTTAADGWRDRVDIVSARSRDASATGLLLRPDCYVAWATDTACPDHHDGESLRTALTTWFGTARRLPPGRAAVTGC
jgi:3-(3-hydroxy-phenyl)propionate hydroxylase